MSREAKKMTARDADIYFNTLEDRIRRVVDAPTFEQMSAAEDALMFDAYDFIHGRPHPPKTYLRSHCDAFKEGMRIGQWMAKMGEQKWMEKFDEQ